MHTGLAHSQDRQFDWPLIFQSANAVGLSIPDEWVQAFRAPAGGIAFHPAVEWIFHTQLCAADIESSLVRLFDY